MFAIIFPGQGSQIIGMNKDYYENFPEVREIFDKIEYSTNIKVKDIIFEDPNKQLDITEFTQICIYSCSISIFSMIKNMYGKKFLNNIKFMAGHSLGEYTSVAAAGVLEIIECAKLLKHRGYFMQNSHTKEPTGMSAVLGLDIQKVEMILKDLNNDFTYEIANDNAPGQVVISFEKSNFEKISNLLKDNGAKKVIPLKVSAGFHSSFMKSAEYFMEDKLNKAKFKDSILPIVSNFNAKPSTRSVDILNNLKKQMSNRVRWVEIIKFFENNNISNIIEIGPGKVLNGLNKRISSKFGYINVSNVQDLYDLKNVFWFKKY